MGLFPPSMGKALAPQGPTGCAPGALLLSIIGQYCLLWGWGLKVRIIHTSPTAGCKTQPQPQARALWTIAGADRRFLQQQLEHLFARDLALELGVEIGELWLRLITLFRLFRFRELAGWGNSSSEPRH